MVGDNSSKMKDKVSIRTINFYIFFRTGTIVSVGHSISSYSPTFYSVAAHSGQENIFLVFLTPV